MGLDLSAMPYFRGVQTQEGTNKASQQPSKQPPAARKAGPAARPRRAGSRRQARARRA